MPVPCGIIRLIGNLDVSYFLFLFAVLILGYFAIVIVIRVTRAVVRTILLLSVFLLVFLGGYLLARHTPLAHVFREHMETESADGESSTPPPPAVAVTQKQDASGQSVSSPKTDTAAASSSVIGVQAVPKKLNKDTEPVHMLRTPGSKQQP